MSVSYGPFPGWVFECCPEFLGGRDCNSIISKWFSIPTLWKWFRILWLQSWLVSMEIHDSIQNTDHYVKKKKKKFSQWLLHHTTTMSNWSCKSAHMMVASQMVSFYASQAVGSINKLCNSLHVPIDSSELDCVNTLALLCFCKWWGNIQHDYVLFPGS